MDADFSHHVCCPSFQTAPLADTRTQPEFIADSIARWGAHDYDIVTGTRCAGNGGVYGWGLRRKLVCRSANLLASVMLRPGVSYLTDSFRLYKKPVLDCVIAQTQDKG